MASKEEKNEILSTLQNVEEKFYGFNFTLKPNAI